MTLRNRNQLLYTCRISRRPGPIPASDCTLRMRGVYPQNGGGLFNRINIQIHRNRLAITAAEHALQQLGWACIDFLVRYVGRHIDKVAGTGLGREFKMITPAHPGTTPDDINHALKMPVVMRAGFCIGMYRDRSGPKFLGSDAGKVDGGLSVHARRLCRIAIELVAANHPNAVVLPAQSMAVVRITMVMAVVVAVVVTMV
jgi:hypothetical protein